MRAFFMRIFSRKERLKARWNKRLKNVDQSRLAVCAACEDPIVPGDFVGQCSVGVMNPQPHLIHAGFHATATDNYAFCESAAIGIGYWDGEKIVDVGESAASRAMRVGRPVCEEY